MASHKIDNTDVKIMETLQMRARTKRGQLAEEAGLSIPTISERLHKLESNGYITGYNAILNPQRVGLSLTAFISLTAESSSYYTDIIEQANKYDEILECHAITGKGSHLLKVRVTDTIALERLLSEIQSWPGVKDTRTDVVLSSPKESMRLPLGHLKK